MRKCRSVGRRRAGKQEGFLPKKFCREVGKPRQKLSMFSLSRSSCAKTNT